MNIKFIFLKINNLQNINIIYLVIQKIVLYLYHAIKQMAIIFKQDDVKVTDLSNDIIGNNYSVEDENTYFETSVKPQLDYESLKNALFEYEEMKNEGMRFDTDNHTENDF